MAGTLVFRVVGFSEVRVLRFNLQFVKIADFKDGCSDSVL